MSAGALSVTRTMPRRPPTEPTFGHVPPRPEPTRHDWRVSAEALLAAIAVGAVAVTMWPVFLWLRPPGPAPLVPLVAHVAGMLAGYGVIVLIGLMSRTPAAERDIGADVLARWHARGGRIVLSLVLIHTWAAVTAWAQSRGEPWPLALWNVLRLPYLMATAIGTVLLVAVAVASIRAARHRLSYEKWHALHLLTYLAVALAFLHQLAGPDLAGHRLVQLVWAALYTFVFALVARYRVIAPLRQAARHRLRVADVRTEARGVVSIEVAGQHLDELHAEAGQFFRWRFLTPDHWTTAHPFSLSAPPTNDRLRLTVKSLGDGSKAMQSLEPGTWVVAEGPYGALTNARRTRGSVLLIAGGVGITPMRALFETLPLAPYQDLLLIYRAATQEQLVFREELETIAARRQARITYVLGKDRNALSHDSLLRMVPDLATRDVFMCGPPGLTDAVRTELVLAGLPPEALHEERFSW